MKSSTYPAHRIVTSLVPLIASLMVFIAGCTSNDQNSAVTVETSPNGASYVRLYLPKTTNVAFQVAWPLAWTFDPAANPAAAGIGARLLLAGGAEGYPAGQAGELMADLKAQANLEPASDILIGTLIVTPDNVAEAMKITNAHLRAPAFDEGWLSRIKEAVKAEIAERAALPAQQGYDAMRLAILGKSPLQRALSINASADIAAVTRSDIEIWHKQTITRDTAKIAIAGNISAKDAGSAVDALLAGLPGGKPDVANQPSATFTEKRILLHVPTATTSRLTFVAQLPPTSAGQEIEDLVLANALGGDDRSVLFNAVRTGLRASYGYYAGIDGFARSVRVLIFDGEIETPKLAEAETVIRKAYSDFLKNGVGSDLEGYKTQLKSGFSQMPQDPARAAFTALMFLLDRSDPSLSLNYEQAFAAVTSVTVSKRLSDVFPENDEFVVLAVSPDASALPGACVIKMPAEAAACP